MQLRQRILRFSKIWNEIKGATDDMGGAIDEVARLADVRIDYSRSLLE